MVSWQKEMTSARRGCFLGLPPLSLGPEGLQSRFHPHHGVGGALEKRPGRAGSKPACDSVVIPLSLSECNPVLSEDSAALSPLGERQTRMLGRGMTPYRRVPLNSLAFGTPLEMRSALPLNPATDFAGFQDTGAEHFICGIRGPSGGTGRG